MSNIPVARVVETTATVPIAVVVNQDFVTLSDQSIDLRNVEAVWFNGPAVRVFMEYGPSKVYRASESQRRVLIEQLELRGIECREVSKRMLTNFRA